MSELSNLFSILGITSKDEAIYLRALTHSSFKTKDEKAEDYERLEFLGDSVLYFVISDALYKIYPDLAQGDLTKVRQVFVCQDKTAELGRRLNLEKYIRTGKSIPVTEITKSTKYYGDVFEALLGAIFLDQGIEKATTFILSLVENEIRNYDFSLITDPISALQEDLQTDRRGLPKYETVPLGPEKERAFASSVSFDGIVLGRGVGANKMEAEKNAAREALRKRATK